MPDELPLTVQGLKRKLADLHEIATNAPSYHLVEDAADEVRAELARLAQQSEIEIQSERARWWGSYLKTVAFPEATELLNRYFSTDGWSKRDFSIAGQNGRRYDTQLSGKHVMITVSTTSTLMLNVKPYDYLNIPSSPNPWSAELQLLADGVETISGTVSDGPARTNFPGAIRRDIEPKFTVKFGDPVVKVLPVREPVGAVAVGR